MSAMFDVAVTRGTSCSLCTGLVALLALVLANRADLMQPHSLAGLLLALSAAAASHRWWWRRSDPFGFERPVDRRRSHTVKHDLSAVVHGEGAASEGVLQMWVADMELPCCPRIQRAIVERAAHPSFGYTIQPTQIWTLVGEWLVARQGWPSAPPPDHFVFSGSVVTSFSNVLHALTKPSDAVLAFTPLYAPLQNAVEGCGRRLVRHPLRRDAAGRFELDAAQLDGELDGVAVLLLCSPHNPSGRVWRRDELRALAAACARRNVLVVADEIWADWCLPTSIAAAGGSGGGGTAAAAGVFVPFGPIAAAAGCAHVIMGAPSKTWSLAGLHASYLIIGDGALRAEGELLPGVRLRIHAHSLQVCGRNLCAVERRERHVGLRKSDRDVTARLPAQPVHAHLIL